MKIAYVTGATGCVGRNLIDELLKDEWQVVVLHRKSSDLSRLDNTPVRFKEVDFYDPESVRLAIPRGIDAIFHVAGNTSHWRGEAAEQWKSNVLVTRHLIRAALEMKVKRFVFTSTGATNPYQHTDERFAKKIRNGYIRTKRLAELEVYKGIAYGLDAVILKPIIVIGPYDYNSYAQIFTYLKASPVRFAFPGNIAFCHASDVARAHILAFEKGRNGEQYVLGGTYTSWQDTFQKICSIVDVSGLFVMPKWALSAIACTMNFVAIFTRKKPALTPDLVALLGDTCDVTLYDRMKARNELGYESRSLDVMVRDCWHWLKKEKLL
jgi:dihydroflavonol-4-reductase